MRHGTCFRRRLSAHHAGAAPHSAVAELGVVRRFCALPVKPARTILLLLVGTVIGIAATIGFQHFRRAQAIRALPSLADRNRPPNIDEISGVMLSRRDGRLHYDVRDGMGGPRKDFETLLAMEREFSDEPPIIAIYFEPGVTMEDIEATIAQLSALGVKRYFLGYSFYGKSVLQ